MLINIYKTKYAFDHLQAERQAKQHRLQLAAKAKQHLDQTIARCPLANHKKAL